MAVILEIVKMLVIANLKVSFNKEMFIKYRILCLLQVNYPIVSLSQDTKIATFCIMFYFTTPGIAYSEARLFKKCLPSIKDKFMYTTKYYVFFFKV